MPDGIELQGGFGAAPQRRIAHRQSHQRGRDERTEHPPLFALAEAAALKHPQHRAVADEVERPAPFIAVQAGERGYQDARAEPRGEQRVPDVPAVAEVAPRGVVIETRSRSQRKRSPPRRARRASCSELTA